MSCSTRPVRREAVGKRLMGLVSVSYTRKGETYSYLTFSSRRLMVKWLKMLEADGASDIRVEWS